MTERDPNYNKQFEQSQDSAHEERQDVTPHRLPGSSLAQPEITRSERVRFHESIKQHRLQLQEKKSAEDAKEIENVRIPLHGRAEQGVNDKDAAYAGRFWNRNQNIVGLKDVMAQSLQGAIEKRDRLFYVLVNVSGLTEQDKEKLSAYRVLAGEIGIELGPFRLNKRSGTAVAEILKS